MKIRIGNKSEHKLTEYMTEHSADMDLRANIDNNIVLRPLQRFFVKTGIFIGMPVG
jgi:dUTP diphosphatase